MSPTALERLEAPLSQENAPSVLPPVEIEKLVLRGERLKANIIEAVTGGELERTIEGASTLTLNLHDPERELLRSKIFKGAVDLKFDRFHYRLVRTDKQGDSLTLTFEDREVSWLRGYTDPRRAFRDKITRAEFVLSMLREVKEGRIRIYCPELHVRQPIEGSRNRRRAPQERQERTGGIERKANLTVKGAKASSEQIANAERVLGVAASLDAPERAAIALVAACIGESTLKNLTYGDSSSVGILQLLDIHLGGSTATNGGRRDVELVAKMFLTQGFTGAGGAISLAKANPSWTPGQIAQAVQGAGVPYHDQFTPEATKFVNAFNGEGLEAVTSGERTTTKAYRFTRGQAGKRESSWDAIQRLAEEVAWRGFMVEGRLFFVSEEDLYRSKPRLRLSEQSEGVDWIDFEWDRNLKVAEARVQCRADMWTADPGTVVVLEDCGPADGRWLVSSMRRGVWDRAAEITLRKPVKEKLEPAPETETVGGENGANGASASSSGTPVLSGSLRQRIVEVATSTLTSKTGFSRYSQPGALTADPTPPAPNRTDCSQWTRAVYLKAGAGDPGTNTWAQIARGKRTNDPRPGDLLFPASQGHVELFIGGGRTIGHGTPPIDYSTVDYWKAQGGFFVTYDFLD